MDYKERYEQALERAKVINPGTADYEVAVKIFPELQESESEKVRKELIHFVRRQIECHDKPNAERDEIFDSWITWLEKQKDHEEELERAYKTADEVQYRRGYEAAKREFEKQGEQKLTLEDAAKAFLEVLSDTPYNNTPITEAQIVTKQLLTFLSDPKSYNPNAINEQKHSDKIEPKFKVGDWVKAISSGNVFKILSVNDGLYRVLCYDGVEVNYPIEVEKDLAYWTIKDAKNGDVLATDSDSICIFDGTVEEGKYPFAYCGLTGHYGFEVYDRKLPFTHNNDVHPATKEQRDLLFSKMKEVGYEWDVEKKELKNKRQDGQKYDNKIEPKFKVNDWITDGTSTFQIVEIRDEWYIADDGDRVRFDIIDQYYHLWTIQDAKPGDVLVDDENNIGIFESFGSHPDGGSNNDDSYCYLFCKLSDGFFYPEFENNTIMYSFCGIHPANREQYELLLQKMKEAAYEFDSGGGRKN